MAQLVAIQMVSVPDVNVNLQTLEAKLKLINVEQPTLVVLPECFAFFGARDKDLLAITENKGSGIIQDSLAELAAKYNVWLVAGTIPLKTDMAEKYTASCLVYDDTGALCGEYQKIHLFDVEVSDATGSYRESKYTQAGEDILVIQDTPFGRLGIAVCYDLRFAGQFLAMQPFDVLALPAAFTERTGQAHWHALLRGRSIENQCYVVAANQGGVHANGRETYGHSCIYSPWGKLLAEKSKDSGIVYSNLDMALMEQVRTAMPMSKQNRFRSEIF